MYASTKVARQILQFAQAEGRPVTPLELIKLTYLAHGWSLAFRGRGLVREPAEAWQYGPVFPELYHSLKSYRANPVMQVPVTIEEFGAPEPTPEDSDLIRSVYDAYKGLNGVQLSSLTHQPGTPWDKAWRRAKNTSIPDDTIMEHFVELREQRAAS